MWSVDTKGLRISIVGIDVWIFKVECIGDDLHYSGFAKNRISSPVVASNAYRSAPDRRKSCRLRRLIRNGPPAGRNRGLAKVLHLSPHQAQTLYSQNKYIVPSATRGVTCDAVLWTWREGQDSVSQDTLSRLTDLARQNDIVNVKVLARPVIVGFLSQYSQQ